MWLEGLSGKHILSSLDFSRDHLRRLYNLAHSFRVALNKNKPLDQICRGKVCKTLIHILLNKNNSLNIYTSPNLL